jgi:Skp family chaperone for outer membrane proteins
MITLRNLAAVALATTFLLPAQENKNTGGPSGTPADAVMKQVPGSGPRIGVVDLVKAIDQYPKWIRLQSELEALGKGFNSQLDSQAADLSRIKAQIDAMDPESDARRMAEMGYDLKMQEARALQKLLRDKSKVEEARALLSVYEDLEVAIAKVVKDRDLSLVLRITRMGPPPGDPAKLPEKTVFGRVNAFERREVLFAGKEIDITDDLIKLLMVPLEEPKDAKDSKDTRDSKDTKDSKADTPKAPEKGSTQRK